MSLCKQSVLWCWSVALSAVENSPRVKSCEEVGELELLDPRRGGVLGKLKL